MLGLAGIIQIKKEKEKKKNYVYQTNTGASIQTNETTQSTNQRFTTV
jgi:hypothetical protein